MSEVSGYISRFLEIAPIQRQSLISLGSTVALTAIGFLSTIVFAHILGPAVLGEYFLFLAYFGILYLIGDGGFGGAAVKRISEDREQNAFFSAFVVLRILLVVISISALLLIACFYQNIVSSGIFFWLLLAIIVSLFSGCTATAVYGMGNVGVYQISMFLNTFVKIIIQVFAVLLGFALNGLVGGFVLGLIAEGLVNYRYMNLTLSRFRWDHLKNIFSFSFWIFLSSSGSLVFCYADTILIGYFMETANVGIYRTAFQLTSISTFTTLAFYTVLYPKISQWEIKGDLTSIENTLSRAVTYSLFLAIPVCIGGWILGERLLYFLYGASFTQGTTALAILLVVQIANVFMYLGTMCLNSLNHPKDAFIVTAIASIINIILDILLIPVLGISGAAIATLIAMSLNGFMAFFYLSKMITIKFEIQPIESIIFSSAVMGVLVALIVLMIPLTHVVLVLGTVLIGGIAYFGILIKTDAGIHDDIKGLVMKIGAPWPGWL